MKFFILSLTYSIFSFLLLTNLYSQNSKRSTDIPEYIRNESGIENKTPNINLVQSQRFSKLSTSDKSNFHYQSDNPRTSNPLGLSLYGFGPAIFLSVSIDYFVSPSLSLEIGGGLFGLYAGTRYHFRGKKEDKTWTTYTGLFYANYGEQIGTEYLFFLPIGRQYTGKNGFSFALEMLILNEGGPVYLPLWPGVRVGYRF